MPTSLPVAHFAEIESAKIPATSWVLIVLVGWAMVLLGFAVVAALSAAPAALDPCELVVAF
jgi:hypothetical protein